MTATHMTSTAHKPRAPKPPSNDTARAAEPPHANQFPAPLCPSPGPVYLEGRLVLSLSFQETAQGFAPDYSPIENDDRVLENYRLWDDEANAWHGDDLTVLRFENIDVVMRLEPAPTAVWTGALDTQARVVLVPDLDAAGMMMNQSCSLRWKKI